MFWKTISPYFVNNPKKRLKITLVDEKDNNTLSEDEMIAEIFNKFSGNIIKNLIIPIRGFGGCFYDTTTYYNCY